MKGCGSHVWSLTQSMAIILCASAQLISIYIYIRHYILCKIMSVLCVSYVLRILYYVLRIFVTVKCKCAPHGTALYVIK